MNTNHVSELWKASLVFGPIFAVLFSVPTYSSFVGFTKYDECPFQPFLPQGLIGFGILGSICSILALILVSKLLYQTLTSVNRSARNFKKKFFERRSQMFSNKVNSSFRKVLWMHKLSWQINTLLSNKKMAYLKFLVSI